ncbi:hypothetical protein [Micrococcus luteus]|uniref:hypothetical protein n=1 Tax=Micrococcus luteus TaxID=1270 RepID=UPI0020CE66E4|nr:hypothetical protein [Micrococcus luteus]UTT45254.1 hypothetical protein NMQ02_09030 [Micrococcus luteus]
MLRTTAPARPATLSLLAVGALALVGCGGGGGEASSSSPSSDASAASPATVTVTASPTQDAATSSAAAPSTAVFTASSSASSSVAVSASADASESGPTGAGSDLTDEQEERVEALEDVLLTPQTAPDGVFTDMETQAGGGGEPISTSLSLTGVTPMGACADLIEQINTQQAPGLGGALAQYEVDPAAVTGLAGSQAGAFGMVAVTEDGTDLLAPFGKLADTCGTFGDPDGVEAAFTKVPGVPDAVHIALGNSGMDTALFTMTVGGVTDGDELVYLGMVGLAEEIAAETLRAQVEAFEKRER